MQSVSTIIFLYFANLAPIVAFGGLLGDATENRMASIEALVGFAFLEGKNNLFFFIIDPIESLQRRAEISTAHLGVRSDSRGDVWTILRPAPHYSWPHGA